ncbi:fused MFS/spermidine synthase [Herbiconiux sp. CPCC 203407]|uniref:Fused MFS/spermidine synthase n=1 Tax=Herbiconiux oxytropis TaxID=2970915 RepID=A0AA41XFL4_9MICO|nr:fused MFS/spermidine synthase [Herbiconiux oxytropis]MCS5722316.1 fused MFS/spermidine synthase [Herbiconiux oxytropis]MCS5727287.1 fused MFS/spermidine synthase [Herbiconiux oxytropis]
MPDRTPFALPGSGRVAEIAPDPLVPGAWVLSIEGAEQSHVDLGDPADLFYDYVRRIGAAIDHLATPGRPLRTVHLGAGALTLARYLQATRPGSEQLAVEDERGLLEAVTSRLPLPAGTRLTVHEGDAADVVTALLSGGGEWVGSADLVIDDLYRGITTPPHLTTAEWYADAARLLAPGGVLVVNIADDDGLPGLRSRLAALAPSLPHRLVLGPTSVLTDARAGNAVVLASRDPAVLALADDLRRAGPHPSAARDARHVDSPTPADGIPTPKGR